jgi:acyl-coenzyme A synthetase/AMP-(fatty) acid ligase
VRRPRFGAEILDGIGSTEMLHVYVISRPGSVRPGSTGSPIDGYEVKVVDERGAPTLPNQIGDLLVKGPSRASAYWNRPDATERAMQGGWFASGDKYSVDPDGYFWYAGRDDDMFKVVGEWVSPVEIEAILLEHPDVLECAVVPWPDDNGLVNQKRT